MEMGHINFQMDLNIKVNLEMTKWKVKVEYNGKMVKFMKEILRIIKCMDMECLNGLME